MRNGILILFLSAWSFSSSSQTSICGTENEGSPVNLSAPSGQVFISVTFASYGTPNGSCGSFTIGGCHAANSKSVVESLLVGKNSASIMADNATFGDPCLGTVKRLYIEAVYSTPLPLKLISFSGTNLTTENLLYWETSNETNTKEFIIERSNDGNRFYAIGTLPSLNRPGNNHYSYSDTLQQVSVQFYRLKLADIDGTFTYSSVIKLGHSSDAKFNVFPNPVLNSVTIEGLQNKGSIEITDLLGRRMQKLHIIAQTQTVNMERYSPGIYIIKCSYGNIMLFKKIIKE